MTQKIDGEGHQITRNGDIINCHGGTTCPFRDAPESQRQGEFARITGVWCAPQARELLETLMSDHGFTVRELAAAWRADSIAWSADKAELVVRAPWVELVLGWGGVALMLLYYLLTGVPYIFVDASNWRAVLAFFVASILYLGGAWAIGRFVFWPRRIALRVRRILAER